MQDGILTSGCAAVGDSHYEYIATYVDDLMIASKDPKAIVADLEGSEV